jgi:hypothetical protein
LVAAKIPSFTTIYTLRLFIPGSLRKICHPVLEELRSQDFGTYGQTFVRTDGQTSATLYAPTLWGHKKIMCTTDILLNKQNIVLLFGMSSQVVLLVTHKI